jgi:hypothetical protein
LGEEDGPRRVFEKVGPVPAYSHIVCANAFV